MSLNIAVQMDNIATINVATDTTYMLLKEADDRGYKIHYFTPDKLTLKEEGVFVFAESLTFKNAQNDFYKLGAPKEINLSKMDVILVRQDPPFDMNYITSTYILDKVDSRVRIINNPTSIRNNSEKLSIFNFAEFITPTIVTEDVEQIRIFRKKHKNIIIKPLYACGGDGIFFVKHDDNNISSIIESLKNIYKAPLMVQSYIKNASRGDKRIIMIDGKPVGAVLRVPQKGDVRSNLHVGGKAVKTKLTKREEQICVQVGTELKRLGIYFAGLDVIEGYLTEINITSPTGVQEINRLNKTNLEKIFWDRIKK